jgi:hypothetical protein
VVVHRASLDVGSGVGAEHPLNDGVERLAGGIVAVLRIEVLVRLAAVLLEVRPAQHGGEGAVVDGPLGGRPAQRLGRSD